ICWYPGMLFQPDQKVKNKDSTLRPCDPKTLECLVLKVTVIALKREKQNKPNKLNQPERPDEPIT
ncbi:MAG: hypothetical protein ABIH76_05620, partial [Candidatus Bathyarchaeota archaeon]